MKNAFTLTTSNSWIGLSTSSKPEKSQSSGVRELQKRKPSLLCLQAAQINTLMFQKKPNPAGRPYGGKRKDFKQGNYKGKGKPRMDNQPG